MINLAFIKPIKNNSQKAVEQAFNWIMKRNMTLNEFLSIAGQLCKVI